MLMTLIPLFDENMTVRAYSLFTRKSNFFENTRLLGTGEYDGVSRVQGLEIINSMGIDTLSADKEVFVPINKFSIFSRVEEETYDAPHDRIVFIIDDTVPPEEMYIKRLFELKKCGYKLAIRRLEVSQYQQYEQVLELMDYMFLDYQKINISSARMFFAKKFPQIKLCAGNIKTHETFEELKAEGGYQFYEGAFYRVPVTKGQHEVVPLKVNYIELLNMVNVEDFDLQKVAQIIGRDTALAISLLEVVNKIARNSEIISIKYAAAMLGQKELKRWINTIVAGKLYADKPNEVVRLSLLRAKFAENLAKHFELAAHEPELFLMGLFSVLDLIMEKPMEEALEIVKVAKEIREVLIDKKGSFSPLYEFMIQYENANWDEVSRRMLLNKLDVKDIHAAYVGSLEWYRDLFVE